ncbi:aminotransferase class I/II-fold pyridoxal phosphate-dependent enzyme [Actinocatenispora rupis]|uniref:GntR family transcriptional regulator n=1 Tax=Actinocatenispora rupis TaxID=519421 RepID=A0A8J3JAP5_9ACTN|nr:PLP-dependent aminotransferase family protein [Actinocatenispora rupis]GID12538.1 GntR family transcriptional regulator [Actinocatenispora rupis]
MTEAPAPADPDGSVVDAAWLADQVDEPSARGIAAAVVGLIRHGQLRAGHRLPTVRDLGGQLGVSPATVSEAWSLLRRRRSISGRGRAGTVVTGPPDVPRPNRFEGVGRFGARLVHDLRLAVPDPALLPPLDLALAEALRAESLNEYVRVAITPRLADTVRPGWPYPAESLLAVNGGFDALLLLAQTHVTTGDPVAIEDPTAPRWLDILDAVGAEVLPVACDDRGPLPDALAAALRRRPVLFCYQPRAHSPAGHNVDPDRRDELARLLAGTDTLVVEDDGLGVLSGSPLHSVGAELPAQTVLVRSYAKSHGPDLRLAVLGGPASVVEKARVYRTFGAGWTSRILQNCLAVLLADPAVDRAVAHARDVYAQRRTELAAALAARGAPAKGTTDGLSLWVPVRDERSALVTLAAAGIAVAPGSRYHAGPHRPHIRVGTGRAIEPLDEVADMIALAATDAGPTD